MTVLTIREVKDSAQRGLLGLKEEENSAQRGLPFSLVLNVHNEAMRPPPGPRDGREGHNEAMSTPQLSTLMLVLNEAMRPPQGPGEGRDEAKSAQQFFRKEQKVLLFVSFNTFGQNGNNEQGGLNGTER